MVTENFFGLFYWQPHHCIAVKHSWVKHGFITWEKGNFYLLPSLLVLHNSCLIIGVVILSEGYCVWFNFSPCKMLMSFFKTSITLILKKSADWWMNMSLLACWYSSCKQTVVWFHLPLLNVNSLMGKALNPELQAYLHIGCLHFCEHEVNVALVWISCVWYDCKGTIKKNQSIYSTIHNESNMKSASYRDTVVLRKRMLFASELQCQSEWSRIYI